MGHTLYAYRVTVAPKGEPEACCLLGNFDDAGADLLALLTQFLEETSQTDWLDHSSNSAVRVEKVYQPSPEEPSVVAAIMQTGETGVSSNLVDTTADTLGTDVLFQRTPKHAELVRALLLAKLPGLRDKGFLITHSPSGRGIKTKFLHSFEAWFSARYDDFKVSVEPTFPEGFYRRLLEERPVKRVTLVKHLKPSDATDAERQWFDEEGMGSITTVLAPKRFKFLKKKGLVEALDSDAVLGNLLTFEGLTYDTIKVTVSREGKDHSFHLQGGHIPRPGYDITDAVQLDAAGVPTYESLRLAALEYVALLVTAASS